MKATARFFSVAAFAILAACGQGASSTASTPASVASTAAPEASAAAAKPTPPEGAIQVSMTEFAFSPATITAKSGSIVFFVTNNGVAQHNLTLIDSGSKNVGSTPNVVKGHTTVLTVNLPAGVYHMICTIPGHESAGMSGTLTVT